MAKTRRATIQELKERLRGGTEAEILTKQREFSDRLFRLKFQFASGQTDTLVKTRELRKDIARAKTILRERQRESEAKKSDVS
jgi:large subunit ribosomal protein L29